VKLTLNLSPTTAKWGDIVSGKVLLDKAAPEGGLEVTLSSNDLSLAKPVPDKVTVKAGKNTAPVSIQIARYEDVANRNLNGNSVEITASYNGESTNPVTLTAEPKPSEPPIPIPEPKPSEPPIPVPEPKPSEPPIPVPEPKPSELPIPSPPPKLTSLVLNPTEAVWDDAVTGTITLSPAPSSDVKVKLRSDNPSLAPVPSEVTVKAGKGTFQFTIPIKKNQSARVKITASYDGSRPQSKILTVKLLIPQ
jgi:outer membrane biosynthesis protein TonB